MDIRITRLLFGVLLVVGFGSFKTVSVAVVRIGGIDFQRILKLHALELVVLVLWVLVLSE